VEPATKGYRPRLAMGFVSACIIAQLSGWLSQSFLYN